MRILALDLAGNVSGWAVNGVGRVHSGTISCDPPAGSLPGRRYLHLQNELATLYKRYEPIGLIAYEKPHYRGGAATEQCVGAVTHAQSFAAQWNIRTVQVHSGTLKKHCTGNGKASKEEMIAWASEWAKKPIASDDEADAVCVLAWAISLHGDFK